MRRWEVLDKLIKKNGFQYIAELGCKNGNTTEFLLANNSGLDVIAVDLFSAQPTQAGVEGGETYEEWNFDAIKKEFESRVEKFGSHVELVHMSTTQAAEALSVAQFDLVFIDADHSYNGVATDIQMWLPKVRSGGIIAGHDYNQKWPSVQRAVADNLPLNEIHLEPDSVWWWRKP